jgi:hypothetical protein
MTRDFRSLPLLSLSLFTACSEPSLDVPRSGGSVLAVDFQPVADAQRTARLFRARVEAAPPSAAPWLFRGELGRYHEQALRRGELPSSLRDRAVPLRFWRDAEGLWLQPLVLLESGSAYELALTGHGRLQALRAEDGPAAVVERIFPPPGAASASVAVLCGLSHTEVDPELVLEPGRAPVRVSAGIAGTEQAGCVTLEVEEPLEAEAVLPPEIGGALSWPEPFSEEPMAASAAPAPCPSHAVMIGTSCLETLDDRVFVTAPADSLWLLAEPQAQRVVARAGARSELLRGLRPASSVTLAGRVLERRGALTPFRVEVRTSERRRHLVLNEVLANPRAAEPAGEWIELLNDSDEPCSLAGSWLEDEAGSVPLPPESIAAGEIVLLVPDGQLGSGLDVAPPSSARIVRLASLGARGLGNGGESLLLVGAEGVISRFPRVASPEAGRSVARRSPGSADDLRSEFALHGAPGASPGAPNRFDE